MARKSRRLAVDTPLLELNQESKVYKTAIYARLSKEDGGKENNSDSIENQIYLVKRFIDERPYLKLCSTYSDNGQTGVNFDRPGFNKLQNDIKTRKIDCIVVKDLSRFGRNYIETGNFLENIFPFLGVRFISVNDNYDSHSTNGNSDELDIALKSLISDIYPKDSSRKIVTSIETKQKNGEFIGSIAPYGYMKSAEDKHKFVIDEEAAEVVRNIFKWKLEGMANSEISQKLNDLKILSPWKYRYEKKITKGRRYLCTVWAGQTVKFILKNPVYRGCMSQGRSKTRLFQGVHREKVSSDKWINVEDTHEAIISKDLFDDVQKMFKDARNTYYKSAGKYANIGNYQDIFKGLIKCVDCNGNIFRQKQVRINKAKAYKCYFTYVCRNYENGKIICKHKKSISEEVLFETIWSTIKAEIDLCVDMVETTLKIQKQSKTKNKAKTVSGQIIEEGRKIERVDRLLSSLYDDYVGELLTESEYMFAKAKYREEKRLLQIRVNELIAERNKLSEAFIDANKWVTALLKFKNEKQLTKTMLTEIIEYIEVSDKNKLSIIFKYRDEYEALLNLTLGSEVYISD